MLPCSHAQSICCPLCVRSICSAPMFDLKDTLFSQYGHRQNPRRAIGKTVWMLLSKWKLDAGHLNLINNFNSTMKGGHSCSSFPHIQLRKQELDLHNMLFFAASYTHTTVCELVIYCGTAGEERSPEEHHQYHLLWRKPVCPVIRVELMSLLKARRNSISLMEYWGSDLPGGFS